jgi:AraC family transcriptional regulator
MIEVFPSKFVSEQTHGFVDLESFSVSKTSDDLDWSVAYISVQSEMPYARSFQPLTDILIVSIDAGSMLANVKFGDRHQRILRPSGSVTLMPDRMAFDVDMHTPIDTTHLYLRRSILDEVAGGLYRGDPTRIDLIPRMAILDPILGEIGHSVRAALDDDPQTSGLYVEHMMRAIAAHLIRMHSDADKNATMPVSLNAGLSASQLAKAREMIEDHLTARLTLFEISSEFGMSSDHFGRLFKQATGIPVHHFVLRSRIDRARRLLAETSLPIARIAFECGFAGQTHLTRSFRRIVGVTPAIFRKARQSGLLR